MEVISDVFFRFLKSNAYIFITIAVIVSIRLFIVTPVVVAGPSMMPTLNDEDKIVVNKISPKLIGYERFDVIVFQQKQSTFYVKRIIGLPGETVTYKNDALYINGELVKEPFLEEAKATVKFGKFTGDFNFQELYRMTVIPEGKYFVLGDNRLNSTDSREPHYIGLVDEEEVLGKAKFVMYPMDHAKWIK